MAGGAAPAGDRVWVDGFGLAEIIDHLGDGVYAYTRANKDWWH